MMNKDISAAKIGQILAENEYIQSIERCDDE